VIFTDNANLCMFENSCHEVNQEANYHVRGLRKWFIANKLSLDISQTCYMVFSSKSNADIVLYYNRYSTKKVDSCRYLGVITDK
jgi:hypothetical protein